MATKKAKGPRGASGRRSEERIVESKTSRGGVEPSDQANAAAAGDVDTRAAGLGMTDAEVDVDERDVDIDEG